MSEEHQSGDERDAVPAEPESPTSVTPTQATEMVNAGDAETPRAVADGASAGDEEAGAMPSAGESAESSKPNGASDDGMPAPEDTLPAGEGVAPTAARPKPSAQEVPEQVTDTAAAVTTSFDPPDFSKQDSLGAASQIDLLDDVELDVKIELGRTEMYIEDVLALGAGSVVELNKAAGDPVDIRVNDRLVARGEVLVLNDNFCVRINDIVSSVPELQGEK